MKKLAVKFACWLLKRELSVELKNRLTVAVLGNLGALPLKETIRVSESGELEVKGKVVDVDKAISLRNYATAALDNPVENLIKEQVAYEAIVNGVHKFSGDSGQIFMRAALWWEQTREDHLKGLAGR